MATYQKNPSAGDAGAKEAVRIEPLNTSKITRIPHLSQPLIGYSVNEHLLVVAVYRQGVQHA